MDVRHATVAVPAAEYSGHSRFWSTITEDISSAEYYHPPCVSIVPADPSLPKFDIVVRGNVVEYYKTLKIW